MKKTIAITCFLCAAWAVNAQIWLTQDKTLYFGDKAMADTCNLGHPGWWNIIQENGLDWSYSGTTLSFDVGGSGLNITANKPVKFGTDTWYSSIYLYNYMIYNYTPYEPSAGGPVGRSTGSGDLVSQLRPLAYTTSSGTTYGLDVDNLASVCPEAVDTLPDGTKVANTGILLALLQQKTQALQSRIAAQSEELAALKQAVSADRGLYCVGHTVYFSLPDGTRTAYIQLCDPSGRQIRMTEVTGETSITVSDSDLPTGEGYASLVVDGTLAGTQKITLK